LEVAEGILSVGFRGWPWIDPRNGGRGHLGPANWVPPTGSRRLGPSQLGPKPTRSQPTRSRQLGPADSVPIEKGPTRSQEFKII
jgi:hypothetical protein